MRKPTTIIFFVLLFSFLLISSVGQQSKSMPHKSKKAAPISISPQISNSRETPSVLSSGNQKFRVDRVIDGDTIELEDGRRVRYIGIDTPETVDPRKPVQCFGHEAGEKNKELVLGKEVELEKDISETDKYGRLLRYVYANGILVNDYLVRNGFARASTFPPDVKYQDKFQQDEREARENRRGLWGSCGGGITTTLDSECQIKGNISSSGEKIYHLPNCPYWSKTVINEKKGEKWFCSEEEAQKAGWRVAQNCP